MATDSTNIWNYRQELSDQELTGFDVEAVDGTIGKIDESSLEADNAHIVVDTGFWIFGKKTSDPGRRRDRCGFREPEGDDRPHQGPDQGCP